MRRLHWILGAATCMLLSIGWLFPPWAGVHPSDPSLTLQRLGFHWRWLPPLPRDGLNASVVIDDFTLALELAAVAFVGFGIAIGFYMARKL